MNDSFPQERRRSHLAKGKKRKPFNIIDFALRRAILVVLIGSVLGGSFAALLYPFGKPSYETGATLLISPVKQPTANANGRDNDPIPGDRTWWTRTQLERLKTVDVLQNAIRKVPMEDWPEFLKPIEDHPGNPFKLFGRIKVREINRTYLVSLSISDNSPKGLAEILNATMEAFIEKLEAEFQDSYNNRLVYLNQERDKVVARLSEEENRILALAETFPDKNFLHKDYVSHLTKLNALQAAYWVKYTDLVNAESDLKRVVADKEGTTAMSLQPFADQRVADNYGINRIELWTYERLQTLRTTIDGLTERNRDRQYVEMRMEAMNEYMVNYKERVTEATIKNLLEKQEYELDYDIMIAQNHVDHAKRIADDLKAQLDQARAEASDVSLAIFQTSHPYFLVDQLRERLKALNNRIDDLEMARQIPVPVLIDQRAETPDKPTSTTNMTLALMGLVLGFGMIGGLVFIYEFLDNRVRTSREIELALGGPGPDPIMSFVSDVRERPDFVRCSVDSMEHPSTLAIRDLAGRLNHDREQFRGRVYSLVGMSSHVGVSALSINLAHCIRNLCGPVLLMEMNVSNPGIRSLLEMGQGEGLETLLNGGSDFEHLIHHDELRNIDVLPCDGSGRPTFTPFPALLDKLREDYDFILIDGGSLPDDVAQFVTRHSDGVVLVARYKKTLFAHLRRGIDQMIQSDVPAVTSILNFSHQSQPFLQTLLFTVMNTVSVIVEEGPIAAVKQYKAYRAEKKERAKRISSKKKKKSKKSKESKKSEAPASE